MKTVHYFLIFLLGLALGSCGHKENHEENFAIYRITEFGNDIKVPSVVWDQLEGSGDAGSGEPKKDLPAAGHGGGHGGETASAASPRKTVVKTGAVFAGIKVLLREKNAGVLRDKKVSIELPKGGGEIDLAKYMGEKKGTFFLNFDFPEMQDASFKKVIFVSESKRRKVEDEVIGSGCNVFYDLTNSITKNFDGQGIKLNTTKDRHASVIGGHFLFSAKKEGQTIVSRVSFTDSARPELFCED